MLPNKLKSIWPPWNTRNGSVTHEEGHDRDTLQVKARRERLQGK